MKRKEIHQPSGHLIEGSRIQPLARIFSFILPMIHALEAFGNPGDSLGLSIQTSGFFSAKFDPASSDVTKSMDGLNHHGAYYLDITPSLKITDGADLQLRVNLQNPSLSEFRNPEGVLFLKGSFGSSFGLNPLDTSRSWKIDLGNFDEQTIGNGLTFKDFQALGASASLLWSGNSFRITSWAQDYDAPGDVFILDLYSHKYHTGLSSFLWFFEQSSLYHATYLLPFFKIPVEWGTIYGEGGIKFTGSEDRARDNFREYPDVTYAGMFGIKWEKEFKGWELVAVPEVRAYGKNFIPLTKVDATVFTDLNNYDRSSNNWVDFFSAVGPNYWAYLKSSLQTPKWRNISLFFDNQILLFMSEQNLFWDRNSSALVSFNPSSDFYWAGIRYSLNGRFNFEALVTNRLINLDPSVNLSSESDPTAITYGPHAMRQYGSRFYPSESPLVEVRLLWRN